MKRYFVILVCLVLSFGGCEFQKEAKNKFLEDNQASLHMPAPPKSKFYWEPDPAITTELKLVAEYSGKNTKISNPHFLKALGEELYIFDLDSGRVVVTDIDIKIKKVLFQHDDLIGNNRVTGMDINKNGVLCLASSKYLYIWKDAQLNRYRNVHNITEFCLTDDRLYCINNDHLLGYRDKLVKEFDLELNFLGAAVLEKDCHISPSLLKGKLKVYSCPDGFGLFNILSNQYGVYAKGTGILEFITVGNQAFDARLENNMESAKRAEDAEEAPKVRFKTFFQFAENTDNGFLFLVANEGRFTVTSAQNGEASRVWIVDEYSRGLVSSFASIEQKEKRIFLSLQVKSGKGSIKIYE